MEIEGIEDYKIPEEALERLKSPDVLRRQMEEGLTFQEIIGYSHETMEKFYHVAHRLFQAQEYEKAADAFLFLTTLNPYVHHYWLGLGMAEQLNGGVQQALLAYAMAVLTNAESPVPHYHSASCYQVLNDRESALQSLQIAINCAGSSPEHSVLKERAIIAKQSLLK